MNSDDEQQKNKQNPKAKKIAYTSGTTEKPQEKKSPKKKLVRPPEYKNKLDAMLQKDVDAFVEGERAKLAKRNEKK